MQRARLRAVSVTAFLGAVVAVCSAACGGGGDGRDGFGDPTAPAGNDQAPPAAGGSGPGFGSSGGGGGAKPACTGLELAVAA